MAAIEADNISSMTYYCDYNRVVIEDDRGNVITITGVVDFRGLVEKINEYKYGKKG